MRKKVRCWAATTLSNHTEVASGRESAVHRAARVAHTRENGSLQQAIRVCACVCELARLLAARASYGRHGHGALMLLNWVVGRAQDILPSQSSGTGCRSMMISRCVDQRSLIASAVWMPAARGSPDGPNL